jgi:hypothetical protein
MPMNMNSPRTIKRTDENMVGELIRPVINHPTIPKTEINPDSTKALTRFEMGGLFQSLYNHWC